MDLFPKIELKPIDIQLKMFDTMVSPILLYGCEVCGFENISAVQNYT